MKVIRVFIEREKEIERERYGSREKWCEARTLERERERERVRGLIW